MPRVAAGRSFPAASRAMATAHFADGRPSPRRCAGGWRQGRYHHGLWWCSPPQVIGTFERACASAVRACRGRESAVPQAGASSPARLSEERVKASRVCGGARFAKNSCAMSMGVRAVRVLAKNGVWGVFDLRPARCRP